jgi:hypothetical protein
LEAITESLAVLGSTAFRWSAIAFLVVNTIGGLGIWFTRDRRLVNRWTSPLLAVNLLLLGTGVGIPALSFSMRAVVNAVATSEQAPTTSLLIEPSTP